MNKEENIITEFVHHPTGFTISDCDLTTGKVVINNIEITSVEDWDKVTKSLVELQQENQQLKDRFEKVINLLCEADSLIMKREPLFKVNARIQKAKEILKGD